MSVGFSMSPGHKAYDAELAETARGLLLPLVPHGGERWSFILFTDSHAAMRRIADHWPGLGQERATEAIRLAELLAQGKYHRDKMGSCTSGYSQK